MTTPFSRLCWLVAASSVYNFCVNAGAIHGSVPVHYVAGYAPAYFAVLWAADDARRTRYWPAYHYGVFLMFFWFLAVPHYVLRTRGRGGAALAARMLALLVAPLCAALAGWALAYTR